MRTNIGNIAVDLSIAAIKPEMLDKGMQKLAAAMLFHDVAGKAFSKKSLFQRDSGYSVVKAEHVKATAEKLLGEMFEGVVISVSEHVQAVSPLDALRSAGVDEATLKASFGEKYVAPKTAQAAISKELEAPAETESID